MLFLGVDIGLTEVQTLALDYESMDVVATATIQHSDIEGDGESAEEHPTVWIQAVNATIVACLEQLTEKVQKVVAIGICGQENAPAFLGNDNQVICPTKLAEDASSLQETEALTKQFGGNPGVIEILGNPLRVGDTASKLLWLKNHEPQHFQNTVSVFQCPDLIAFWLTGEKQSNYSSASTTGLFDIGRQQWQAKMLQAIDPEVESKLPPVASSKLQVGTLRLELSEKWNLHPEVSVSSVSSRLASQTFGNGALLPGSITLDLDPNGQAVAISPDPKIDYHGQILTMSNPVDHWLSVIELPTMITAPQWLSDHYGWSSEQFEAVVANTQSGAEGLIFFPKGEKNSFSSEKNAGWSGVTSKNFTTMNMAKSVLEGMAFEFDQIVNQMREARMEIKTVRLVGEGAQSPAWRQIIASVLNLPVQAETAKRESAYGAALHAAMNYFQKKGSPITLPDLTRRLFGENGNPVDEPNSELVQNYKELLSLRR